jgi:hypothetical protein
MAEWEDMNRAMIHNISSVEKEVTLSKTEMIMTIGSSFVR